MAATNASSALLAFPNEVLDDILGHLVTSIPPNRKPTNPGKSSQLEALEAVSLVSKKWRAVALRRLVAKLVVRTGTRARAIVQSLTSGDLGGLVKEIKFEGTGFHSSGVPTAADMAKTDSVTPEDVVALVQLTRRLKSLRLYHVAFVRFRQRDAAILSTLPFLATVDTLAIEPAECDINLELMATLIPLFPALRSINLSITSIPKSPRFQSPPPQQPFLEALELSFHNRNRNPSIPVLFSLISTPNPGQIKRLKLSSYGQPLDLDSLLKEVGPGLETLECDFGEDWPAVMRRCSSLVTLRIYYIRRQDSLSLLRNLPATVITLRVGSVHSASALYEAIATVPKPSGLVRLELSKSQRSQWNAPKLEAYGLEVVCGSPSFAYPGADGFKLLIPPHLAVGEWS
ncbi:hypothetical protein RQP46_003901 [Phenoliferia psychrophenolica]